MESNEYAQKRRLDYANLLSDLTLVADELGKAGRVNRFFNKYRYLSDEVNWKVRDYWAGIDEFIAKGQGDCEDYAIAKYFTLRAVGVDEGCLKLAYVIYKPRQEAHMVLLYYPNNDTATTPMVLDNIDRKIHTLDERKDLQVKFAFDSDGIYVIHPTKQLLKVSNDVERLGAWSDMLRREKGKWC